MIVAAAPALCGQPPCLSLGERPQPAWSEPRPPPSPALPYPQDTSSSCFCLPSTPSILIPRKCRTLLAWLPGAARDYLETIGALPPIPERGRGRQDRAQFEPGRIGVGTRQRGVVQLLESDEGRRAADSVLHPVVHGKRFIIKSIQSKITTDIPP